MDVFLSNFVETRIEVVDPRFKSLILFNAQLEKLFDGCRWLEGPVWLGDQQRLLASDIPNDRILCWDETHGLSVFRHSAGFPNGQTRDRYGRLLTCSHGHRALLRTEHNGQIVSLVDSHKGQPLNTPNDVVVKSDGTIWFSDPLYGLVNDFEGGRRHSFQPAVVYRFDPADRSLQAMTCPDEVKGPNGLAFSPDELMLYVVDTCAPEDPTPNRMIHVFDVEGGGRQLTGRRDFYRVNNGNADGIRIDIEGNVWSSAGNGIHCIAPDGTLLGRIITPHLVGNLCFGGIHGNRLFLCSWDSMYSIYVNTRGIQHTANALTYARTKNSLFIEMTLDRHPIRTLRANKPVASYSQGYRVGQFVFVSGQMPVDPETNETVEGGSAEHTRQCLKNVFGVLEEAGCTYRDVGQAVVYMTNIDEIDAMDAVWQEFFPDPNNYCSRAVIGISKLVVGARIEISCIAIKD